MKKREYVPTDEQLASINKHKMLDSFAVDTGFTDLDLEYNEFILLPLAEALIEQCAKIADEHASAYSGEHRESTGCHGAAGAIRAFSKTLRNDKSTGVI